MTSGMRSWIGSDHDIAPIAASPGDWIGRAARRLHTEWSDMKRVARATPWLFVAVAVAFVVSLSLNVDLPEPWWRLVIITCGGAVALLGVLRFPMPFPFVVAMVLAVSRLALLPTSRSDSPAAELSVLPLLVDIAVGLALCMVLAIAVRRRHGEMCRRDFLDVLAITIGASIVTWLLVTNPLINDHGVHAGMAIAASAYLPISALIVTFTIDLMFAGLAHNR